MGNLFRLTLHPERTSLRTYKISTIEMLSSDNTIALALGLVAILVAIINVYMMWKFRNHASRRAVDDFELASINEPFLAQPSTPEESPHVSLRLSLPPEPIGELDRSQISGAVGDALDAFSRLLRSHQ
ncbi:hypothetical protein B0O99DRAFT_692998 [Bisporella sp. PMI_857]|nr:hypothetical protein B0O99DRAFT_692998 [Bisporella sp. PMI_857]